MLASLALLTYFVYSANAAVCFPVISEMESGSAIWEPTACGSLCDGDVSVLSAFTAAAYTPVYDLLYTRKQEVILTGYSSQNASDECKTLCTNLPTCIGYSMTQLSPTPECVVFHHVLGGSTSVYTTTASFRRQLDVTMIANCQGYSAALIHTLFFYIPDGLTVSALLIDGKASDFVQRSGRLQVYELGVGEKPSQISLRLSGEANTIAPAVSYPQILGSNTGTLQHKSPDNLAANIVVCLVGVVVVFFVSKKT